MRHVAEIRILAIAVAAMAVVLAAGCAETPLRTEKSTSGIRAAEEVGAAKVPKAALHLQLAKEALDEAKKLAAKDEKEQATSMLMRAEADAELAVALSRGDAERMEAKSAVERVRKLRQENQ